MAFWNHSGPCGTVTQATSKSTAVSVDGMCGTITMHNASLAATTTVSFTVNNGNVRAGDTVALSIASGATAGAYLYAVDAMASGSFQVSLRNVTAGALGEAVVMNFTINRNS